MGMVATRQVRYKEATVDEGLVRKVRSLAQLDGDAVSVYEEALKHETDEDVRAHFIEFHAHHAHHVTRLSAAIVRLGGEEQDVEVDFMGVVADWVVAFRSMLGEKGPLHAMHTAESYHNTRYKDAVSWEIQDAELMSDLKTFYAEEMRHLKYIEERLAVRA
jgi:hypothetical protein